MNDVQNLNPALGSAILCVSLILIAGAGIPASALGGWSSGGGELLSYQRNPWWQPYTQNTILYCVRMDENNFGMKLDTAKSTVSAALHYWDEEMSVSNNSGYNNSKTNFKEEPCSDETQLRFQLGILTEEQQAVFPYPQKYVGEAVMTKYNPVTYQGVGFIYVAPEKGPWGLSNSPQNNPKVWSGKDGINALQAVLQHEIGHTFGIGHSAADSWGDLMHEWFPTDIVSLFNKNKLKDFSASKMATLSFRAAEKWKRSSDFCFAPNPEVHSKSDNRKGNLNSRRDSPHNKDWLRDALNIEIGPEGGCLKTLETLKSIEIWFSKSLRLRAGTPWELKHTIPLSKVTETQSTVATLVEKSRPDAQSYQPVVWRFGEKLVGMGSPGFLISVERNPLSEVLGSEIILSHNGDNLILNSGKSAGLAVGKYPVQKIVLEK